MFDDIPIVPNLYEAPSNPQIKDCYYNITVDKYYIYDGTQWLEAKLENDPTVQEDTFILEYSQDGGQTFTTEEFDTYDQLLTRIYTYSFYSVAYSDVKISMKSYPAVIIPRTDNLSLKGVALLALRTLDGEKKDIFVLKYSKNYGSTYVTETYDNFNDLTDRTHSSAMEGVTDIKISSETTDPSVVGRIYPKIIFNQQLVKKLNVNKKDTLESVFDGVLVFHKTEPHYKLSWIDSSNENHSMIFSNYMGLKAYIEDEISSGSMIDVSIEEVEEE